MDDNIHNQTEDEHDWSRDFALATLSAIEGDAAATSLNTTSIKLATVSNDAQIEASHDTFTVFPDLPAELRLKIWKLALPRPRLVEIKFWNEEEAHVECFSKDVLFSMALLDVCKESTRVFRQNYSNSAIILSDIRPSNLDPTVTDTKGLVQHGYIDLERDILYFDPNTVNQFLRGNNVGLKVAGLKSLAIASRQWTAVLIMQKAFGQSAFPSLKHLTIVLNEVALQVKHIELEPKCNTYSLVTTSPPTDDSTLMIATFGFGLAKVSKTIFDRVNNYEGSIQTATVIGRDSNCSWNFFASQESHLLVRVAEGVLQESIQHEKNINCIRERMIQVYTETCRLIEESRTMRKPCLGEQVFIFLYIVALGCLLYSSTHCYIKKYFNL